MSQIKYFSKLWRDMLEGLCTGVLHSVLSCMRMPDVLRVGGVDRHLRAACLNFPAAICTLGHTVPAYIRERWRAMQIDPCVYPGHKEGIMRALSHEMFDSLWVMPTDMHRKSYAQISRESRE